MMLDFRGSGGLDAAAGGAGVEDCGVEDPWNSGPEPEDCRCCMDDNGRDPELGRGGGD